MLNNICVALSSLFLAVKSTPVEIHRGKKKNGVRFLVFVYVLANKVDFDSECLRWEKNRRGCTSQNKLRLHLTKEENLKPVCNSCWDFLCTNRHIQHRVSLTPCTGKICEVCFRGE